jgi:hypothetical protein
MARVTLKDIERQLQAQDEAWKRARAHLSAHEGTQLVLGETFLEEMLAIDERAQQQQSVLIHFNARGV